MARVKTVDDITDRSNFKLTKPPVRSTHFPMKGIARQGEDRLFSIGIADWANK